jgi:hypothetical protein
MDIIVTIPKRRKDEVAVSLKEYEETAKDFRCEHFFRLPHGRKPRDAHRGDRCWIVIDGYVRGCHEIDRFQELTAEEAGKLIGWSAVPGLYVVRKASTWKKLKKPIPMRGFQGFRYANQNGSLWWNLSMFGSQKRV